MKTTETKHQFIFQSEDEQGIYEFRVHKHGGQIQLATSVGDWDRESYIDTDIRELTAIRDMLNKVLELNKK